MGNSIDKNGRQINNKSGLLTGSQNINSRMIEEMDKHYTNRLTKDNLMKAQGSNSFAFGDKSKNYMDHDLKNLQ